MFKEKAVLMPILRAQIKVLFYVSVLVKQAAVERQVEYLELVLYKRISEVSFARAMPKR